MDRKCTRCGATKSLDQFEVDRSKPGGYRKRCAGCARVERAAYYAAHREQAKAVWKARYAANSDAIKAKAQDWRNANRERVRAKCRAYHATHSVELAKVKAEKYRREPGPVKARAKAWEKANPEKKKSLQQRRRARLRAVENTLTGTDILEAVEASCGLCAYCLQPYVAPTVDHVEPVSKGGANAAHNIVIACVSCNSSKNDRGILCMVNRANVAA